MGLRDFIREAISPTDRLTADPAVEERIVEEFRGRRAEAVRHYERTGDSSRMWAEKSAQNDAIWSARNPGRRSGRR
ncbi:hypothetical protein [Streptomyces mirabilis]|uniref:hypothetical protein n=1 Tax=Streptomyces mirabilis TaxID=68239 RepID=UPI0033A89741